eukprot:CAMPEP_0206006610 /NCGR_PEP_ID=MMETSP1464-20131121/5280_1 /ASSEMBLY_ACC=CAM_ASM_001124 /TAXON_ID=119497 /ORGANISM="Exanthemachrysis gayraliae, Strain RCC1523" /LENGTH=220 /DNA_ID=CAMNT_0053380091 /DNA_START=30 /DNA_END=693 /DNA_ORIENTATION=+
MPNRQKLAIAGMAFVGLGAALFILASPSSVQPQTSANLKMEDINAAVDSMSDKIANTIKEYAAKAEEQAQAALDKAKEAAHQAAENVNAAVDKRSKDAAKALEDKADSAVEEAQKALEDAKAAGSKALEDADNNARRAARDAQREAQKAFNDASKMFQKVEEETEEFKENAPQEGSAEVCAGITWTPRADDGRRVCALDNHEVCIRPRRTGPGGGVIRAH